VNEQLNQEITAAQILKGKLPHIQRSICPDFLITGKSYTKRGDVSMD